MEYLKSGLKSVLGAPSPENSPSGAETVERLVDRLSSSTLLGDRRDACRALKALSRTYRIEVGVQGMDALKQILYIDKTDYEILGLSLDTLCNITNPEIFDEEVDKQESKHSIGEQFTEIFIKKQDTVSQVLKFLEEFDFRVRWSALKLLSNLLLHKSKDIQEIILESPMGISKLMDLLGDSREVIRGIEGGIVVEDCLLLMVNLLRGNYSNQYFFKEGNYIQRLTPMFQSFTKVNENKVHVLWNSQKVSNVHCMIQVIRALVVPNGSAQLVTDCQKIMKNCHLLQALCDILMIIGVPTDILAETICSVAEVIRGNAGNQEFLAYVMAPSIPPRSAIVVLLMSMGNYYAEAYLHSNNFPTGFQP
ncbi:PREDICTED: general vesicular transport factor p115 [Ceratosolen solmsi marchali]|uniref:General vesicular transport factor p115 n=1 Tax=Ceratosolen solmsi marchali TaxID=326594 RepID=A0AAJ7DTJ1_9HYME|nr:PREDICTED: general vesicular transport factor p115 [Ceratosolen solmsi marchali]